MKRERAQLSTKNPCSIPKHRYYELKHFCLQYPDWKKALVLLDGWNTEPRDIPGIIKGYEYMMIPYLLAENPDMSRQDAFAESKRMMDGNKMDAFVLDLSFIGWFILGAITFNIVNILYTTPYMELAHAELYHTLKNQNN